MRLRTTTRPAARSLVPLLALAGGLLALAGCGSSSKGSSTAASTPAAPAATSTGSAGGATAPSGPAQALKLASDPEGQLKYDTTALSAKAGTVSIAFTNMAPLEHNLTVASSSGSQLGATETFKGGTKTLTLKLPAGVYKFYCTVPGHRASGMEGTLTVR